MSNRVQRLASKPENAMDESKLSLMDCLLAPGAMLFLMTGTQDKDEEKKQTVLQRLREKIAFARAQPLDIYLGARHQL
jgi:hypothetical protein